MTSFVSALQFTRVADYLLAFFQEKQRRNPSFSLRQFAKQIGVPATSLSNLFSGKRNFSIATLSSIARKLKLSSFELEHLLSLQSAEASGSDELKTRIASQNKVRRKFRVIPEEFSEISHWYSIVIVEALGLSRFGDRPEAIAESLGLPKGRVEAVVERMLAMGVLEKDETGRFRKKDLHLLVSEAGPKAALRSFHKQMLLRAIDGIRPETTHERYLASEVFPFSKSALPEARMIVDRCLDELIALSGRCDDPDTLYQAGFQFFEIFSPKREKACDEAV